MGWRASVAMAAVHMREMENRARDKIQGCIQLVSKSVMREDMDQWSWSPQGPGMPTRWTANKLAFMMCGCMIVM